MLEEPEKMRPCDRIMLYCAIMVFAAGKIPAAKNNEKAKKFDPQAAYDKFKSVIFAILWNKSSSEIFLKANVGAVIPLE